MQFSVLSFLLATSSLLHPISAASPSPLEPLMPSNFADLAIIQVNNTYYTFSTGKNAGPHVPIASSPNLTTMTILKDSNGNPQDALPNPPPWANQTHPNIWAPDVLQLASGKFVLYFSATPNSDNRRKCIGAATSTSVTGPYTPSPDSLACDLKHGCAIDPAGFIDGDGRVYVVYKVDGNSLGGPEPCGNGDGRHATPLMLQEVSAKDGFSPIADATTLIDRDDGDGPLIEAPALVRSKEGVYVLFFSSNCYKTEWYDTAYATSRSLKGPYMQAGKPLLKTGTLGLFAPGGADVLEDGERIVFHANKKGDAKVRQMFTSGIKIDGTSLALTSYSLDLR